MTTRTPPGWYPDPGHTGFGPAPERWWDGEAWSEHTRDAPAAATSPTGFPQQPGFPPGPPQGAKPKGPLIAGITASIAVAVALVVGAVVIANDDDSGERAGGTPTPTASRAPSGDGTPDGGSTAPTPGELTAARGVTLPLLDGWERAEGFHGASVHSTPYTCPLKDENCVRAGATVFTTSAQGSAEAVAKADIEPNSTQSYGKDYYGGITSHEEVASRAVQVAGRDGWLVRWKIDNRADPDAYVQSVAFPHPDGSGQMLVLRAGFDINEDSPPVSHLDKLVSGVEEGEVAEDDSGSESV